MFSVRWELNFLMSLRWTLNIWLTVCVGATSLCRWRGTSVALAGTKFGAVYHYGRRSISSAARWYTNSCHCARVTMNLVRISRSLSINFSIKLHITYIIHQLVLRHSGIWRRVTTYPKWALPFRFPYKHFACNSHYRFPPFLTYYSRNLSTRDKAVGAWSKTHSVLVSCVCWT